MSARGWSNHGNGPGVDARKEASVASVGTRFSSVNAREKRYPNMTPQKECGDALDIFIYRFIIYRSLLKGFGADSMAPSWGNENTSECNKLILPYRCLYVALL